MDIDIITSKLVNYFVNSDTFEGFLINNDVFEDKICSFIGFDDIEFSSKVMDNVREELVSRGYSFSDNTFRGSDNSDFYYEDSVKQYLNEIGRYPLLSKEEEYDLAIRVKSGDQDALKEMMNSNLRLVVFIAKRYVGRGVDFLDLVQEGNIGLMKAVYKFNPDLGFKFSTYASLWIRQTVRRSVDNNGRTMRIPVFARERIDKLSKLKENFFDETGREPTYKELAELSGFTEKYVEELFVATIDPVCLDKPSGEFDEMIPMNLVVDENQKSVEETICDGDVAFRLQEIIDALPERDAQIILHRFGFVNDRIYTLKEIGDMFGLSRERVRQLEFRTLKKLEGNGKVRNLKDM